MTSMMKIIYILKNIKISLVNNLDVFVKLYKHLQ